MAKNEQTTTEPMDVNAISTAPRIVIAPWVKDPKTGATYIHRDLVSAQDPWEEEAHVPPTSAKETFGDVESWVEYIKRYGDQATTFLSWNKHGLRAVLDYTSDEEGKAPGRCQWTATLPFVTTPQWQAWTQLANGQALGQKSAVERLEDLASDIVEPAPAELMGLLRSLRASVNAHADAELRPDGTTRVLVERDARVTAASAFELPSSLAILIPIVRGHVDEKGVPVAYRVAVRLRVNVEDGAKLSLRFTIPTAERALEAVYADRVTAAKNLLGADFYLGRAAD